MGPDKVLTNVISLMRFAIGEVDTLKSFPETIDERFERWIKDRQREGKVFTSIQIEWLKMIKDHIATSLSIEQDDLQMTPFQQKGGLVKAHEVFGEELIPVLAELNEVLVA